MTPSQDEQHRATTEAARWLVALDEDPDDADLRGRFEAWRDASPANARAWADTADIYDLMARTAPVHAARWAPLVDVPAAPAAEPPRPAGRPRRAASTLRGRPGRRAVLGMAGAALAACLLMLVAPVLLLRLEADHRTGTAELRTVRLEDGSAVRLGPASAIAVDYGPDGRAIRLLRGEAFFEVVRDADRPFRVAAQDTVTTVLGTAFDVRLDAAGTEVAVERGQVEVARVAAPPLAQRLQGGEWLRVAAGGPAVRGTVAPDEIAPWLRGQIVARDRPLADVVDALRAYFPGVILVLDGDLGRRRLSGVYNVADPAAALRAMAAAHGGQVRRISPWLMVVSGG